MYDAKLGKKFVSACYRLIGQYTYLIHNDEPPEQLELKLEVRPIRKHVSEPAQLPAGQSQRQNSGSVDCEGRI